MAKRKNLQNNIDEYEKGYIQAKLDGNHILAEANDSPYQFKQMPYNISIKCKNQKQKEFLNLLKNKEKTICVGHGAAGSGKSWIAYAYALSQLKDETSDIDQIIVFIPCAQAGSKEISLGLLKGSIDEKTAPFCEATLYTIEKILKESGNPNPKATAQMLKAHNRITFELINFARGKTFDNCVIILDESENISKDEMLLILSRVGCGTKIILIGDELQKDRKDIRNEDSGMITAVKKLNDLEEFGSVEFSNEDIVRNPLITKILELWK